MHIDGITLADLQVFNEPDGRGGIAGLFEGTESVAGRRFLHSHLAAPGSDAGDLRATQAAVRFFDETWRGPLLPPGLLDAAATYLTSNIDLGRDPDLLRDLAHSLWLPLRERDLCKELRSGVTTACDLLRHSASLFERLLGAPAPQRVRDLAGRGLGATKGLSAAAVPGSLLELIRLDRQLRHQAMEALTELIGCLAELDALHTMGATTREQGWVYPTFLDGERFTLRGRDLYHPFVQDATANPVRIEGGEPVVFLTGPNMAGKTTYMRSVGLAVLLAQAGMGVPAADLELTPVDVLLTGLNPADNLRSGLSFFFAEVLRVKAAAEHLASGRRCLVLFDEVFKGTNVKDALEASLEVITGFSRSARSGSVFSSHLVELAEPLSRSGRVRFASFEGEIVEGRARYSYRLKPGVSEQRFGLQLLREASVPELLAQIATAPDGNVHI